MSIKLYLLRFHRWIALAAALPLLFVIVTGLILSLEPLVQRSFGSVPVTAGSITRLLDRHDAEGKASGIAVRAYDRTLLIQGAGAGGAIEVDLASGEAINEKRAFSLPEVFRTARQLHEHLLLELRWLVTASTIAMLAVALIGIVMGWPRFRNTLGGWHAVSAWLILPLALLVPLTGLTLAFGISFTSPPTGPRSERVPIREAVQVIARSHDVGALTSLRMRGGRLVARIYDGQRLTGYVVSRTGLAPQETNWPRALHEGNWNALAGSLLNLVASVVFLGLWVTGLIIWARRKLRRQPRALQPFAL